MSFYLLIFLLLARVTNVTPGLSERSEKVLSPSAEDAIGSRSQDTSASGQGVYPNDVYMNYLLWPHLHFSGNFIADVSTVNNNPLNYDTDKIIPSNLSESRDNWNPKGTGEWSVKGVVTQVCYPNGTCLSGDEEKEKKKEPILGALVIDGGNKSSAKLVDLDTEAQLFSEIWGWRIRIGDFFSADFTPVPFQYIWKKMVNQTGGDHTLAAAYQSVLNNIRWIKNEKGDSPFVTELRNSMEDNNIDFNRLSIRLNVDMFEDHSSKDNFTTGRITGTIGLMGIKSPPFFTHGRMMRSLSDQVQNAPFYVDKSNKKVAIDFGNSLPIDEYGNMDTVLKGSLLVAVNLDADGPMKCSDNLIKLGLVDNDDTDWYRNTAGVQIFPASRSLSDDEMEKLENHPLVVAEALQRRLGNLKSPLGSDVSENIIIAFSQFNFVFSYTWSKRQAVQYHRFTCEILLYPGPRVVKYKIAIKESLKLPREHPNHMPVTRELSESKRHVIVEWLSQENPLVGNPGHYYSVEQLRQDLQTALQLEHATIPPYLTALASIKFSYNLAIQNVLKEIVIQEMMHMALVANILNAIGGQPSLYSKEFIPRYPSRLPGGVQPDLIVPIEKVSLGLIRNIFMKIEQPILEKQRISILEHMFDHAEKLKMNEMEGQCQKDEKGKRWCMKTDVKMMDAAVRSPTDPTVDDQLSACFLPLSKEPSKGPNDMPEEGDHQEGPQVKTKKPGRFPRDDRVIVKQNSTIAGFYIHILNALGNLTGCGKDNSIFTGNRSKQVDFQYWSVRGHSIEVYDFITAVEAIKLILEQGEGSSPCNPMAWNTDDGKSLSHYFLFLSIAERREIRVWNKTMNLTMGINDGRAGAVVNYTRLCNTTYHFIGPKIPFDPHGVWPMIPNPVMNKYKPGSKAYLQAERFNKVYTKLLKSLHNVFNGQPDTLKDALGIMYSVDLHLKKLVHTSIADDGDPDVGPNAGPTFDFTP
ncbi:uncharacterized protein [Montipora capricornis]|uniref:uncharacterized protein n=1 Tax=Montipora capricornis TaxID=246305 RepID=UPI0035F145DD